jgi:beta-barrel assembly-enhancing protease
MGMALVVKMGKTSHASIIARMRSLVCRLLSVACLAVLFFGGSAMPRAFGFGMANAASLPALGEAASDVLSGSAERRLGRSIFEELLRAGVVHDDPEAQDYLQVQASRLLAAAVARGELGTEVGLVPEDFRFFLVKDPSINAFALPGGYIGVHTGLIVQSARESELMSVLAHEIGHVTQRHIARLFGQQRQSSGVMIAAALLAAIAASRSPDAAMGIVSLGQTVAVREQLSFSRDAEREADRIGLLLLEESGFAPEAMAELFQKLSQAGRYYESSAPSWLRSHPLTIERIADVQTRLQARGAPARLAGSDVSESLEYAWIRQRLAATADQSVDGLNRTARLLAGLRADAARAPVPDQALVARLAYGQAWTALAQGDGAAARAFIDQSIRAAALADNSPKSSDLPAVAQLSVLARPFWAVAKAGVWQQAGEPVNALAEVEAALLTNPQSVATRALIRIAVSAELDLDRVQSALARAQWLSTHWPQDPEAWRLHAQAAAAANRMTEAHAAQAERYVLLGGIAAALEQLSLARKAAGTPPGTPPGTGDGDQFMSLSRIDARIAQLRREMLRLKEESRQP